MKGVKRFDGWAERLWGVCRIAEREPYGGWETAARLRGSSAATGVSPVRWGQRRRARCQAPRSSVRARTASGQAWGSVLTW